MTHQFLRTAAIAAIVGLVPSLAFAGETEDQIIDKVIEAYGGDKLTSLESLTISQDIRSSWIGQGYTPDYVQLPQMKSILQLDLEDEQGSVEVWNPNFGSHTRALTTEEGLVTANYGAGVYQTNAEGSYYGRFGGSIRTSDTLLAYELSKQAESAEHQGTESYVGGMHDVLTFEMPQSPPITLYINRGSGLIAKMHRSSGGNTLVYHFGDHTQTKGIRYARDFDLYVDGVMVEYTKSRKIGVNDVGGSVFRLDGGLEQDGERVDTSEMTVEAMGEIAHHVGTGGAYSTFIDAGDHIIGVGGYAGLKDRWEAYEADHEDAKKPLRYMIVTHHHEDHMQGLSDADDLGVTFITPAMAVNDLKRVAGSDLSDDRIKIIETKMTQGPTQIYDIATGHVGSYALVYVPESKTVIQVDHYNGQFVDGPSPANRNSLSLKNEIDRLGLDVETIMSLHGRKAESWDTFSDAVAKFDPDPCASGRRICS